MVIKISIRHLRFKIYYFNDYVVFIFYIKDVLFDNIRAFAQIIREIYIIHNFKANILIKANIFIFKKIIIDFVTQFIKINNCRKIIIFINFRTRFKFIKLIIKLISRIILSSHIITLIIIVYVNNLSTDRDLLFKS